MSKERLYRRTDVVSFRTTSGIHGGLSNMAPGFPVILNGTRIRSVEALYQALRFPHLPDAQREIIQQHSPMTAKMVSRRFIDQTREDWDEVKIPIMRWCLRLKLAQNWEAFSGVLLATGKQPIVEDSRKDPFWGAVPKPGEQLEGQNVLGRLLMELREKLRTEGDSLRSLPNPSFSRARLFGEDLEVHGSAGTTGPATDELDLEKLSRKAMASRGQSLPNRAMPSPLPKRLIEVDLPIKRISAHARREKSIRHGHISTLHIWWARRPLAACRAVICAALWPDPKDDSCPAEFRAIAAELMYAWGREQSARGSEESAPTWTLIRQHTSAFALCNHLSTLRQALLDFIGDFANWDNSTAPEYLETARMLTAAAHWSVKLPRPAEPRALGWPGLDSWDSEIAKCKRSAMENAHPVVVDPFAGGGAIPLEALRVGADSFASDLNPIPVLLNKVVLEYVPAYGQVLADEIRKWGEWIKRQAENQVSKYYPASDDGSTPIAYLWARTIRCEGPGCGAELPLIRSLWLAKKSNRSVGIQLIPDRVMKRVDFQIIVRNASGWVDQSDPNISISNPNFGGTIVGASATCPCCGFTTPKAQLRAQLYAKRGGAYDARLFAVVATHPERTGRIYRLPTKTDVDAAKSAADELELLVNTGESASVLPTELLPRERVWKNNPVRVHLYGMQQWRDLYSPRQQLALVAIVRAIQRVGVQPAFSKDPRLAEAVQTILAMCLARLADRSSTLCTWRPQADQEKVEHVFTRQALPMTWDFAEGTFLSERTAGWNDAVEPPARVVEMFARVLNRGGNVVQASATEHPLPDDSAHAFISDPPYYDAVPYANLSDYFYVWLKRAVPKAHMEMFSGELSPKDKECVLDEAKDKDHAFYERTMTQALTEGRRILEVSGIGVLVFAHKSTAGWEAMLKAVIDAGWMITASWPIDTEMGTRLRAMNSAALASSVHLVCRPRQEADSGSDGATVGDWRDVLQQLPSRIHDWMPRLAEEGVVGADAIFACLGPALEVFSRYQRVERANGEIVELGEYLEHVWAAVSKEALSMVFAGADATGFEEDSRLTAMWLWTLNSGTADVGDEDSAEESEDSDDGKATKKNFSGFSLEFDAARKIAQGLGAHLEDLGNLIEIAGDTARLLPVAERTSFLFGKEQSAAPLATRGRKQDDQLRFELFQELTQPATADVAWGEKAVSKPGETTLDRVHQSMILFAAGRGEALRRFLVDDGAGKDQRFWRLAQALSALYPKAVDEKRWIDGVLARKKGLGL